MQQERRAAAAAAALLLQACQGCSVGWRPQGAVPTIAKDGAAQSGAVAAQLVLAPRLHGGGRQSRGWQKGQQHSKMQKLVQSAREPS